LRTRVHYRVVALIIVILGVCSVSAFSGSFSLQVGVDGSAQQVSQNLAEITYRVVEEELGWNYNFDAQATQIFSVNVSDIQIDTNTFSNRILVQMEITFSWLDSQFNKKSAFLLDTLEGWDSEYEQHLTSIIRKNGKSLTLPQDNDVIISQVDHTGYWTTSSSDVFPIGSRYRVYSADNSAIALLEVSDTFQYSSSEPNMQVTELVPVWSRRTLVEGMPLEHVKPNLSFDISVPFSLQRIGFVLGSTLPIPTSQFRFRSEIDVSYVMSESAYEIMAHAGISRRVSLGGVRTTIESQGSWWTNIQLGVQVSLAAGILVSHAGDTRFMYGADVELEIVHQSLAHWYWGVTVGYTYTTSIQESMFLPRQHNIDGIILSPTIGWIW